MLSCPIHRLECWQESCPLALRGFCSLPCTRHNTRNYSTTFFVITSSLHRKRKTCIQQKSNIIMHTCAGERCMLQFTNISALSHGGLVVHLYSKLVHLHTPTDSTYNSIGLQRNGCLAQLWPLYPLDTSWGSYRRRVTKENCKQ